MRMPVVLACVVVCGGCFQSSALIKVNADGSGTIEHQTQMTTAALAQMRQLTAVFGGNNASRIDPFSEAQARDLADKMGDGVSLMSSTPLKTAAGEGRANIYGFRDISRVRFTQVVTPGDTSVRASGLNMADIGAIAFDLRALDGGTTLLTLHVSGNLLDTLTNQATDPVLRRRTVPLADQVATMRQLLAGLQIAIRVEPAGRLIRTSSPYVDGKIVTLLELNLDEFFRDDSFSRLMSASSAADAAAVLKGAPGLKINPEREITIEFAP
jgi:3-hydroxymyristoyl/3-hydroxydecanoyl-(acyl carrier protein) dehydratase